MHQNDAEAIQQNATQLNPIPIPWNRINITTISFIISQHSTNTKSPHPHHTLSPSPKIVQEIHEPSIFQSCYSQSNYHKQDFSTTASKTLFTLIKPQHLRQTKLGVYLQPAFTAPLQSEAYLESSGTSAVEFFYGNNQRLKAAGYFRRRTLSWIFDRTLSTTLPISLIIGRRTSEEKLSINRIEQGNLGLTLPPNFCNYSNTKHKSKKRKSWTNGLTPRSQFP